jgi:DNA-directed RNA polymerase alpha subunit
MRRDYVWDHRIQLRIWKRNAEMLQEHREGSSVLSLSEKHGLSVHWTKIVLKREERLQSALSSIPKKKVTVLDMGPFRVRTGGCLARENLIYLPIEEFYKEQNAESLLRLPLFGKKSLHEIAVCLKQEGYDIAKFTLPQPSLSWIGKNDA